MLKLWVNSVLLAGLLASLAGCAAGEQSRATPTPLPQLVTSQQIIKQYPRCKAVANTYRFDHKGILYYTTLYTNQQLHVSSVYTTETVIDKVGSGDCYMAGLIYGFYKQQAPQEIVEFATAAAFQKLFIKGDATNKSVEAINASIKK